MELRTQCYSIYSHVPLRKSQKLVWKQNLFCGLMAQTWHAAGGPPNVTILRTLESSPKRPSRSVCDLSIVCTDGRYKYLGPRGVQTVSNKSSSWKQILLEKMPIRLGDPCLPFPRQRSNPIFVQNMLAMDTRIAFLSSACDVHSDAHRLCDREK